MAHKWLLILYQNALNFREYHRDTKGRFSKSNSLKSVDKPAKQTTLTHIHDRSAITSKIKDWIPDHKKIREVLDDKELEQSLASLNKLKTDSEIARKRGQTHIILPKGINLSDVQKKANKQQTKSNLNLTIDKQELGNFYRFNNGRIGGIISTKDGVHKVSLKHLFGVDGTTDFKSESEADYYLKNVIQKFAEDRLVPVSQTNEILIHHAEKIEQLKSKLKNNPYKNADKKILDDNVDIAEEIVHSLKSKGDVIATVDQHGNIQAAAKYKGKGNHIYIDFLATAPWNLAENHDKKVKGAGAKTLAKIAQKSIEKGFKGKLILTPLSRAKPFYQHLGFEEDENGKMHLSPDAAKKLIEKYGDK